MKKLKIFLILLVLFVSISAVNAEGNFTSLEQGIYDSTDKYEITQDYKYNTDENYTLGVFVNKTNFVIEGNGHTIDGSEESRVFRLLGDNITVNNLKIINGHSTFGGGIYGLGSNVVLNNITFIANNAKSSGGAAIIFNGSTINNCKFVDNYAQVYGTAVYAENCNVEIIHSTFSEKGEFNRGMIYGSESGLTIDNCIFANSTAKYAPAIYNDKKTYVKNSKFLNLHAEESAGAIAIKQLDEVLIENCTFINATSVKNAGAVFIDTEGFGYNNTGKILINESEFYNCSSEFGGALVILSGMCEIVQTTFANNSAVYDGGAIYSSQGNREITRVLFSNNKLTGDEDELKHGGAIYSDWENLYITQSNFLNNDMHAVYIYGSDGNITYSRFLDNGEAVHGVFLTDFTLNKNEYNNDTLILNDTDYSTIVEEKGAKIELVNNSIILDKLPVKFDLRDLGWVSTIKNQGTANACWTFGTVAALESALLKATGIEYDFSENNMQNNLLKYSKYGISNNDEGAYADTDAVAYLINWFGMLPTYEESFDEVGKISQVISSPDNIHVQDVVIIDPRQSSTDNNGIKEALLKYGAVSTLYRLDTDYYNAQTSAYYYNSTEGTLNHVVAIVGWDDNYSKDNFLITPPGNGAWIIKNSYGINHGEDGFDYVSYYDGRFAKLRSVGVSVENTEPYVINYQTDLGGRFEFHYGNGTSSYFNNYESIGTNLISAVGTYFRDAGENFTLEIYVNDDLKLVQNGSSPFAGFHTVKLNSEIPVKEGDSIRVWIEKKYVPLIKNSRQHFPNNVSFSLIDGNLQDLAEGNFTASLKVYAKELTFYTDDLTKIYKNASRFEALIGQANQIVSFEVNGATYERTTDEDGIASIAINLEPGEYDIKTTFNGTTVQNTIKILPTLIAENLVKFFRNDSQFHIKLIDGEGNPISGQTITMNINGVFYDRTTDENGTATLNINLEPGEYILTAKDPLTGLEMAYTITVLPTLTGKDLSMSYKDGSQFEATLVDGKGNPLANVDITFNINGVFYDRTTDENGTARLNINLMPGEYIITSQYGQALTSNKITIVAKEE